MKQILNKLSFADAILKERKGHVGVYQQMR